MAFIVSDYKIDYVENGEILAEVNYLPVEAGIVDICHTEVSDALRGQGIAGKLMACAAEELRKTNRKAILSCSYAIKWFKEHPDYADILW